ncbi:MAG: hypothetical protein IPL25_17025 [Saprospiraceae bacterium]|nr:hypothetical protein [Candidatus Vicinibacter affinis]
MKKMILLFYMLISTVNAQEYNYIDSIRYILFPENDSTATIINYKIKDSVYNVPVRYIDHNKTFNNVKHIKSSKNYVKNRFELINPSRANIVSYYCEQVREEGDTRWIESLDEILKLQEYYVLNEWANAYSIPQYSGMFDLQYEILMNLDLTITYLLLKNKSSKDKYNYLENLYMLQWGDRNKIRLEGTLFRSNIIRNMLKGACYSSSFCSTKMICQMADEIGDEALNQLSMINKDSVTQEKSDFYLLLLNMLKFYNSDKVEDVIINNINNLNSLLSESYSNSYYKMQIYQLLCSRGKEKGLLFLLEDAINPKPKNRNNSWYLKQIYFANNFGKSLVFDRITSSLSMESNNEDHYLMLLTRVLDGDDKMKAVSKIKRYRQDFKFDLNEKE